MSDQADALPIKPRRLAIREIHGNVTVTKRHLTAWYTLAPQRWSFRTDEERYRLTVGFARQLAALSGNEVVIRVTDRPYPAKEWAKRLDEASPDALPGWHEAQAHDQRRLLAGTPKKVTFVGVILPDRGRFAQPTAFMEGLSGAGKEIRKRRRTLDRLATIAAGDGMGGRPATTPEIEWLLHRSVRLGLPPPRTLSTVTDQPWAFDDMHVFTDDVTYYWDKWSPTVKVEAVYQGNNGKTTTLSRHIAVVTLGRVPSITIPSRKDPWLQALDRFPFPTEVLQRFPVLNGPETAKEVEGWRLKIRDMQRSYRQHDIEEPLDLQVKAEHARRIEHETTEGDQVVASRAYGWHRIAIGGNVNDETNERCLERVEEVLDWYRSEYRMEWQHPKGRGDAAAQFPLYTEFTPGEAVTSKAYMRRLPTRYVAAALPHVGAAVGDDRGPLVAHTAGSSRSGVHFDPFYAMEVAEAAGAVGISGNQGAGKSTLLGEIAHDTIARGIVTTGLDPAALLGNIENVPLIASHTSVLNVIDGDDGCLSPYAVVPDPLRGNYDTDDDYMAAMKSAPHDRKALTIDIMSMLLTEGLNKQVKTPVALQAAVARVEPTRQSSLWAVLDALRSLDKHGLDEHGAMLADHLHETADMPLARLFFANNVNDEKVNTDTGLIITMHGLQLPDGKPRNLAERMSVPILHLATHLATSRVYGLPRTERKMLAVDEIGLLGQWESGRTLLQQLCRNTRKWNLAALLASQNGKDILGLSIANFISTAFVGRTEDEKVAAENLQLLGVKEGRGYEGILQGLSALTIGADDASTKRGPREFVMRDVFGRVERVRVDLSNKPDLLKALYTTPGRTPVVPVSEDVLV